MFLKGTHIFEVCFQTLPCNTIGNEADVRTWVSRARFLLLCLCHQQSPCLCGFCAAILLKHFISPDCRLRRREGCAPFCSILDMSCNLKAQGALLASLPVLCVFLFHSAILLPCSVAGSCQCHLMTLCCW